MNPRSANWLTHHSLYQSCGILGATVMPHSLFLGSGVVQSRLKDFDVTAGYVESTVPLGSSGGEVEYRPTLHAIRGCLKYSIIELALSLFTFALFVNSAILIVAGSSLYDVPGGATRAGHGHKTLQQLIMQHPKAYKREAELRVKHGANYNKVLQPGEKYMLSYAANHNRGAQFINLQSEIDDRLVSIFDKISIDLNDFFYGRYDILCASVEDLKQEKNFCILEYNGCGAEPNHFYDTGYTLMGAYKEILMHWKALYKISRYNYKQGIKYWPFMKGWKFLRETDKHYRIIRHADKFI